MIRRSIDGVQEDLDLCGSAGIRAGPTRGTDRYAMGKRKLGYICFRNGARQKDQVSSSSGDDLMPNDAFLHRMNHGSIV